MCGERGHSEKILSSKWEKNKQNKTKNKNKKGGLRFQAWLNLYIKATIAKKKDPKKPGMYDTSNQQQ